MKLYKVKATETWEYVIEVNKGEIAEEVAKRTVNCSREYDSTGPVVEIGPEITSKDGLPGLWDIKCLPWGTYSNFREFTINDILNGYDE